MEVERCLVWSTMCRRRVNLLSVSQTASGRCRLLRVVCYMYCHVKSEKEHNVVFFLHLSFYAVNLMALELSCDAVVGSKQLKLSSHGT